MHHRPKLLILYPYLTGGGAQMVCAWMIQALKDYAEVHLATFDCRLASVGTLNSFFGTCLQTGDFTHHSVTRFAQKKEGVGRGGSVYLQQKILAHYAHRHVTEYDGFISAFGYMPLPEPSMAYIHFPQFKTTPPEIRSLGGLPDSFQRRLYRKSVDLVTGLRMRHRNPDVLLCNSRWTADCIRRAWKTEAKVIYPPVVISEGAQEAQEPEHQPGRFCCIGRMHPEKELEWLFDVGELLVAGGIEFSVDLICGGEWDENYASSLEVRLQKASGWLTIHREISRENLLQLLRRASFGIHCKKGEHFGIAVAEMIGCGVVPFVRDEGGVLEIVNFEENCICHDVLDAVEKISLLMRDDELAATVRKRLREHAHNYSAQKFLESIRKVSLQGFKSEDERS